MQKQGIVIGAAAVLIAGAIVYFAVRPKPEPPPPAPPPQAQAAPPRPADAPLPPAGTSDEQVRKAMAGVSPKLADWLKQDALLDRWVVIVDNLAEDVSPRKQLPFAAPSKDFKARKGELDPRSYQRYDLFAEVIGSIDAKAFAAAVRELHPLLDSAYHQLGYPDRGYDEVAQKALQRLIDAPAIEGPIALAPKGAVWRFADDKLEALGPVEKHLLRMGPRNTKLIQAKAREVAAALDLRMASH